MLRLRAFPDLALLFDRASGHGLGYCGDLMPLNPDVLQNSVIEAAQIAKRVMANASLLKAPQQARQALLEGLAKL